MAPSPPAALPEPVFKHPLANRQTCLAQTWVGYVLQRAPRKTIGFLVDEHGLVVRAPKWVSLADVESALHSKADWVLRKLADARARQQRMALARVDWQNGVSLPYMGQDMVLRLDPTLSLPGRAVLLACTPAVLSLRLAPQASAAQIKNAVRLWFMEQAAAHFTARLHHFAPLLGVNWRRLSLTQASTRWGSAKSDGSIRLNWKLMHFKPEVIDYVVAHELSHLRVMNHSPAFWDTVRTVVPDYPALRQQLRQDILPDW